jgi:hypothetical protein
MVRFGIWRVERDHVIGYSPLGFDFHIPTASLENPQFNWCDHLLEKPWIKPQDIQDFRNICFAMGYSKAVNYNRTKAFDQFKPF